MEVIKGIAAVDALVVIENAKCAVEAASLALFGEALTADADNDIPLRDGGRLVGDLDCLFTGPSVHLLMERKRRVAGGAHGSASSAIAQVRATRLAYTRLGRHMVGGRACRVESMAFVEALDAAAQSEFLAAGIYVMSLADMVIHSPPRKD